jgi:hypothetical protein
MSSCLPISFDRRMLILGIFGTACLAAAPAAGASTTFDGVYTGERSLTKGSVQCVPHDDVSITIKGTTATFSNSTLQNYVMSFSPHEDGSFSQISTYRDHSVIIQGRMVGDIIEADVASETCEHHWRLKKE